MRVCDHFATADLALSQKLAEEITYEREAAEQESGEPEFLKAFKEQGTWQVRFVSFQLLSCFLT